MAEMAADTQLEIAAGREPAELPEVVIEMRLIVVIR